MNLLFNKEANENALICTILRASADKEARRRDDFIANMLW
jgi:hypothetical protein